MAGREIFKKRHQLRAFNNPEEGMQSSSSYYKTTNVEITTSEAEYPFPVDNSGSGPWLQPPGASKDPGNGRLSPNCNGPYNTKSYARYTVDIASSPCSRPSFISGMSTVSNQAAQQYRRNRSAAEANRAAYGYTKVALLFFISLLVTWVPSSLNRVYSLANHGESNIPLAYIAGTVLSLMGFWNSLIYIVTTRAACKDFFFSIAMYRPSASGLRSPLKGRSGLHRGRSVTEIVHERSPHSRSPSQPVPTIESKKYHQISVSIEDVEAAHPRHSISPDQSRDNSPSSSEEGLRASRHDEVRRVSWHDDWQRLQPTGEEHEAV